MSILQNWVTELGLRHQGVILTGLRGCDGAQKEDDTKPILREMRGLVLVPFDARELKHEKGFMTGFPSRSARMCHINLLKSLDHYPTHFIWHFIHAIQVIGYKHPSETVRMIYGSRYVELVSCFHVNPETLSQMNERLWEDRIKLNKVI